MFTAVKPSKVAVLPGDGIGPDVSPAAEEILHTANQVLGREQFQTERFPQANGERFVRDGYVLDPVEKERLLTEFDSMLHMCLGRPDIVKEMDGMAHAKVVILDIGRLGYNTNVNMRPIFSAHEDHNLRVLQHQSFQFQVCPVQIGITETLEQTDKGESIRFRGEYSKSAFRGQLLSLAEQAKAGGHDEIIFVHKANILRHAHGHWKDDLPAIQAQAGGIRISEQYFDSFLCRLIAKPESVPPIIIADSSFADVVASALRALNSGRRVGVSQNVDLVIMRENTEGAYSRDGSVYETRGSDIVGIQTGRHTELMIRENVRASIELAKQRGENSITVLIMPESYPKSAQLWLKIAKEEGAKEGENFRVRDCRLNAFLADAVASPSELKGVYSASNLIGDLAGDAAAALVGGMGIPPTHSFNTSYFGNLATGKHFYEPLHGSAVRADGWRPPQPNPIAALYTSGEMLAANGRPEWRDQLVLAVHDVLDRGCKTPDLGGTATTRQFIDEVKADFRRRIETLP